MNNYLAGIHYSALTPKVSTFFYTTPSCLASRETWDALSPEERHKLVSRYAKTAANYISSLSLSRIASEILDDDLN